MKSVYDQKEHCYGCNACSNICPTLAIRMKQDEEGFAYPTINDQKCIDCKMCVKVCPFHQNINITTSGYKQRYFAVQHKDKFIVAESSSGGMFTALSDYIIDNNGIVYGAAFDNAFTVRHMRACERQTRNLFRGSKYIQSDINTIYNMILNDLSQNRLVLFTGTPCQVNGIRNFLICKKCSLENMVLCDFICHGVASPKVWESYIDYFNQKYEGGLTYYAFRGKMEGWNKCKPILRTKNADISSQYNRKKSFHRLYQTCFLNRPSCYSCIYTNYIRCSDITLADFWNIKSVCPEMDDNTGTSQILINTEKGQKIFDMCRNSIRVWECTKKDVWQPHLEYPPNVMPSKRIRFWHLYSTLPFEKVLKQYGQGDILTKCKNFAVPIAKKTGLYVLAGKLYQWFFVRKEQREYDK